MYRLMAGVAVRFGQDDREHQYCNNVPNKQSQKDSTLHTEK